MSGTDDTSARANDTPLLPRAPISPTVGSFLTRLARERSTANAVILRESADAGMFRKSVRCHAGNITIVGIENFKIFRDMVSEARLDGKPLDIRFGSHPLLPSEVLFADSGDLLWKESTIQDVLRVSGAPEVVAERALDALGLKQFARKSPRDLKEAEARKLAIVCALYSRARVIALEGPFRGLSTSAAAYLGSLLLERVQRSQQVFIIGDADYEPPALRQSPLVRRAERSTKFGRFLRSFFGEEPQTVSEIGRATALKGTVPASHAETEFVITYPQLVPKPVARAEVSEELKREMIQNPGVDIQTPAETVPAATSRRRSRNKLTRVSLVMRIVRQSRLHALVEMIESYFATPSDRTIQRSALSGGPKLQAAKERERIRLIEMVLGFALFTFLLMWFLRR